MVRTIVILGAGMAGLPIAHQLAKRAKCQTEDDIRVILVSPHDHFYWKLAAPRFTLPDQMAEDMYMYPLDEQFVQYPRHKFELVIGAAQKLEPEYNTVYVRIRRQVSGGDNMNNNNTMTTTTTIDIRRIEYHTLVVATGTRYRANMPWKEAETTAQTRSNVEKLQREIRDARSIVVAGAGPTGVELAAELGLAYACGRKPSKEITLVGTAEDDLPLTPGLVLTSVRETAKRRLERLGVSYIGGVKATTRPVLPTPMPTHMTWPLFHHNDDGEQQQQQQQKQKQQQEVTLTKPSGETRNMAADLLIPAYGPIANASFAPDHMRNPGTTGGHLRQGPDLRAPGYDNIFVLGDVGDLQPPQASHAAAQVCHLIGQFSAYLARNPVKPYEFKSTKQHVAISLSRKHGTGQAGSWQIWSSLVWYLKSRHLGTDQAAAFARGKVDRLGRPWPKIRSW